MLAMGAPADSPESRRRWGAGGMPVRPKHCPHVAPEPALLTGCQVSFTSASSHADRAYRERAGRSQPANGRLRHAVGARQLCLRGSLRQALHGLTALMGCERRRTTEVSRIREWGLFSTSLRVLVEACSSHHCHLPLLHCGRFWERT